MKVLSKQQLTKQTINYKKNSRDLCNQIICHWNRTDKPYPKDKTIHQLFEEQVVGTPDNTALIFEDQSLTYQMLNQKSNQLARAIRLEYSIQTGNSLQPDTLIVLCLERSFEMIISILAVLKAGGAYVPIDPEFPEARIQYILEDTKTKIVLTQNKFKAKLTQADNSQRYIAVDQYNFTGISTDNLPIHSQSNDLVYVIYTSGTTGKPKGVMILHGSVINCISNQIVAFKIDEKEVICLFSNYDFDASVEQIFLALSSGNALCIPLAKDLKDIGYFKTYLLNSNITHFHATPSYLSTLTQSVFKGTSVKRIISGGESFRLHIAEFSNSNISVFNEYGPTETTITSIQHQCNKNKIPIGKPIQNTKVYILNNQLLPVTSGTIGELYISGASLARGYLNQPELTKECFINNPFATKEDIAKGYAKLYKTGDLCRYLPDGNIEYIGRSDFQVKIRGFRIELGEIENEFSTIDGIKQVCVIVKSRIIKNTEQQYLAAFYVLDQQIVAAQINKNTKITSDYLMAQLKDKLPTYMIPSSWVELAELPLTTNGKLNRNALLEPEFILEETYIAPHTDTEKKICQIWQDILNIAKIGVMDNFFKIGVDSIIAIHVGALLSERFNKSIYVGDIFKYQTIKALSDYIDAQADINNKIPIARGKVWPLSFPQQRLCFIEAYEKGTNAYHVPWLISFVKDININALKQSIDYISKRHQTLKTIFKQGESGEYYQVISPHPLKIQQRRYSSKNQLLEQLAIDVNKPFDLFNRPPTRIILYQKDITQFTHLLINIHHVAIDGWSLDILANELLQCYEHFAYQKALLLPTLKIQYKDFACWQKAYLQGERLKTQLNYWRNKLSNYETLSLATDKPRPANFELVGNDVDFILNQHLSGQLKNLARKQGCTLHTLMSTGFYILLHKYTSQQDIIIGTPVANRHYPEIQNLIGFFVNQIILRQQVKFGENAKILMETIREDLLQAQLHQDIPFEKLVTELDIDKDTSRHPIFQVAFSVQSFEVKNSETMQQYFKTEPLLGIYEATKFDLLVIVDNAKDPMKITINYASALFNKITIERLAVHYQLILTQLVEKFKTQAIQDYRIITDQEYQQIVYQWNQTGKAYPKDKTIYQLFEAQVLKLPNNIALIFEYQSMTYQKLNIKSNQLARIIRLQYIKTTGNKLQPDTLIALCLERSFEMIISMLAVLKAGGAYVPIDPYSPQARIQYILEDTQAEILLTQQSLKAKLNKVNSGLTYIAVDHYNFTDIAANNLPVYSQPNDLAYVIYTSGTTGQPKGVMQTHHNLVRLFAATANYFKFSLADAWTLYHNYTFDFSVWEMWGALCYGGKLVIVPQLVKQNLFDFYCLLVKQKITVLNQTPEIFYQLLDFLIAQNLNLERLSLRFIIFGGDKLDFSRLQNWWMLSKQKKTQSKTG